MLIYRENPSCLMLHDFRQKCFFKSPTCHALRISEKHAHFNGTPFEPANGTDAQPTVFFCKPWGRVKEWRLGLRLGSYSYFLFFSEICVWADARNKISHLRSAILRLPYRLVLLYAQLDVKVILSES